MQAQPKTSRQPIARMAALALAGAAIAVVSPALAQADAPQVTFEERAIVQEIPGSQTREVEIEVERHERHEADSGGHALEPMGRAAPHAMHHHPAGRHQMAPAVYPGPAYPGHPLGVPIYFPQPGYPAGAMPDHRGMEQDHIGRSEWLEECRARHGDGHHRRGDRREVPDECEAHNVQHEARWQHMYHGYGPVMLVPIMVMVEQRAVVREYVTEEWVEEEVMVKVPGKKIIHTAPAPKPVKTIPVKPGSVK